MGDPKRIEQQEGALTFARIAELERKPVEGRFDVAHLREVHRRIFQDLPRHSPGEFRPDAPGHIKGRQLEQGGQRYHVHYAPRKDVEAGLSETLGEVNGGEALRGLNAEQFSARMAKLYGDLDYLHPFKEGNSRTLRAFTGQLAREVGRELSWNATNADAASRDRLYMARDKEVLQRAFPGLDEARAMKTDSRAEYEAYITLARLRQYDELHTLVRESAYNPKDLAAARMFREESAEQVLKKHPELAGAYGLVAAVERKALADGLEAKQVSAVVARTRENLAASIERGETPALQIRVEVSRDRGHESER